MDQLDLDINNYSVNDLESFFKLNPKYSVSEIELKETQIREQLLKSGHINKRFQRDLIYFLDSAKKLLINFLQKEKESNAPTTIPKDYKLDHINNPVFKVPHAKEENLINRPTKQFIYTQPGEFLPGNLNQLDTRIISKCLNIDTRFRTNLHNTNSSDITIQLPSRFNKVVSMELTAIEMPVSFYGISENYGNNYMHISVFFKQKNVINEDKKASMVLVVPDGNYTESDLIDTLNHMLLSTKIDAFDKYLMDGSGNFFHSDTMLPLSIDEINELSADEAPVNPFAYLHFMLDINENGSGSRRVSFGPRINSEIDIVEIILNFSLNKQGEQDNTNVYSKLGWNLGFTKPKYISDNFYNAETIIEPATKYLYLAVDDFNNNSNSNFISVFNQSIMSTDIFARISIKGSRANLLADTNFEIVSDPRLYFGPVDIQRLRIRLLDEQGRVLQMNNSNYSLCLKLKMLYDL